MITYVNLEAIVIFFFLVPAEKLANIRQQRLNNGRCKNDAIFASQFLCAHFFRKAISSPSQHKDTMAPPQSHHKPSRP